MRTILILMDSLNRRFLKAYHSHAKGITPNIDRFSEDCVRFDNHFIGSAPCMPARRDIMTGRMNFLERNWGGIEPFDITLPEELRKNGVLPILLQTMPTILRQAEKTIVSFLIPGISREDRSRTPGFQK